MRKGIVDKDRTESILVGLEDPPYGTLEWVFDKETSAVVNADSVGFCIAVNVMKGVWYGDSEKYFFWFSV